ncbi:MAG TPA: hypothetical protein VLC12_06720 [Terriglobales bacterium]|nr:hypothetical protein [Terriglobales bacterium]
MRQQIARAAVLIFFAGIALSQSRPVEARGAVAVTMRNVMYHFTPQIAVHIFGLTGWLTPTPGYPFPVFDDARSFVLHIAAANMSITLQDMSNILNRRVFAAPNAPLKDISIAADGQTLKITGKLHSHGDIPFEADGVLSLTPQGEIRIHSNKVKAAHLPVKGLMDLLGVHISGLINTHKVRGLRAEKNDLLLNSEQILPLPRIAGRLTAIQLQGNAISEHFGRALPPLSPGNYMTYRGGRLRFGKLTMHDTDMQLLDMDPQDPFDFYLAYYQQQLVAGYAKTTPTFGLRVFMLDYNKLKEK